MNPRFAKHGDGGPFHFETRFIDAKWEWDVREHHQLIGSGNALTFAEAEAQMIAFAGRGPDEWRDIGPDLSRHDAKKVAAAAIAVEPATTVEDLHSDIASATGLQAETVNSTVARLTANCVLKRCVTPAANLAAGDPPAPTARVWYEKGERWKEI